MILTFTEKNKSNFLASIYNNSGLIALNKSFYYSVISFSILSLKSRSVIFY